MVPSAKGGVVDRERKKGDGEEVEGEGKYQASLYERASPSVLP